MAAMITDLFAGFSKKLARTTPFSVLSSKESTQTSAVLVITFSYARALYPSMVKMVRHIYNLVRHQVVVLANEVFKQSLNQYHN